MCVRLADEGVPIDVADVPLHTGLDEPNRHDRDDLAVAIQVATLHESVPRDQRAGSVHAAVWGLVGLLHLGQEPRREKENGDPRPGCCRVVVVDRRLVECQLLKCKQVAQAALQAVFIDSLPFGELPMVQAPDQHGVVREIDHRARPEGRKQLALT